MPAVQLGITLDPATLDALVSPSLLGNLRRSLAASTGPDTNPEAVFFASSHSYKTGLTTMFSATDPINTLGRAVNGTDNIVDAVIAGKKAEAGAGSSARRELLLAPLPPPRRSPSTILRRALQLSLAPGANAAGNASGRATSDPSANDLYLSINILAPNMAAAKTMASALKSLSALELGPAMALLALAMNVSSIATGFSADSVAIVELQYRRSFWQILWDLIAANIGNVLGGTIALIVVSLLFALRRSIFGGKGRQCWRTVHPKGWGEKPVSKAILPKDRPKTPPFGRLSFALDSSPTLGGEAAPGFSPSKVVPLFSKPLFATFPMSSPPEEWEGEEEEEDEEGGGGRGEGAAAPGASHRRQVFAPRAAWVSPEAERNAAFIPAGGLNLGEGWGPPSRSSRTSSRLEDPGSRTLSRVGPPSSQDALDGLLAASQPSLLPGAAAESPPPPALELGGRSTLVMPPGE